LTHPRPARTAQRQPRGRAHLRALSEASPAPAEASLDRAALAAVQGAATIALRPSSAGQELICSTIGLTLKLSLALVAAVSLVRLAGAYQQRLDRYGEIDAVLDIQKAKLLKAQNRFDSLFSTGGEQRLIQQQDQWIAPNRLRVVWRQPAAAEIRPFPTVERP
jgi:hypothetical protein